MSNGGFQLLFGKSMRIPALETVSAMMLTRKYMKKNEASGQKKYRMDSMNILSFNFEMSICFSQVTKIILSFEKKKKRKENAFDYL